MIPVCEPAFFGKEKEYVQECMDTNWISSLGRFVPLFEKAFSGFIGTKHGIACSNGTSALYLAYASLGIGPGDEVIIPNLSNIASANSVILSGAKPVLVDIEEPSMGIDASKIEEKITSKTKAILVVHLYGHPCDMDAILEITKKHNLLLVEDCAEAHGASYKGKKVGSFGDASAWSFYSNKILMTGEGGMVLTNSADVEKEARLIRDLGFTEPRFHHSVLGFNYRMTNIQAAIGYAQVECVDAILAKKKALKALYDGLLADVPGIRVQGAADWAEPVLWMYVIFLEDSFGMTPKELMGVLKEKGIDSRPLFFPFHRQPLYTEGGDDRYPNCEGDFPVSDKVSETGLYLPSGINLTEEQVTTIVDALKEASKA